MDDTISPIAHKRAGMGLAVKAGSTPMTNRAGWMLVAAAMLASGAMTGAADGPRAAGHGGPRNLARDAAGLPEIPRDGKLVRLPLKTAGPVAWRPIRDGVKVESVNASTTADGEPGKAVGKETVKVSYKRTRGLPAGAALMIRPGTLADLEKLELSMSSARTQRLSFCLTDQAGIVWTFPTVGLTEGQTSRHTLKVTDIAPDAYQNKGKVEAKFDARTVVMITVIDIAGFMSTTEPDCEWTLAEMTGVCQ